MIDPRIGVRVAWMRDATGTERICMNTDGMVQYGLNNNSPRRGKPSGAMRHSEVNTMSDFYFNPDPESRKPAGKFLLDPIDLVGLLTSEDGRIFFCYPITYRPEIINHAEAEKIIEHIRKSYAETDAESLEEYNQRVQTPPTPTPRQPTPPKARVPTRGHIYLLRAENGLYKIGRTKNLKSRVKAIQDGNLLKIELIHVIESDDIEATEAGLHGFFSAKRTKGEWFKLDPEDVEKLKGIDKL